MESKSCINFSFPFFTFPPSSLDPNPKGPNLPFFYCEWCTVSTQVNQVKGKVSKWTRNFYHFTPSSYFPTDSLLPHPNKKPLFVILCHGAHRLSVCVCSPQQKNSFPPPQPYNGTPSEFIFSVCHGDSVFFLPSSIGTTKKIIFFVFLFLLRRRRREG